MYRSMYTDTFIETIFLLNLFFFSSFFVRRQMFPFSSQAIAAATSPEPEALRERIPRSADPAVEMAGWLVGVFVYSKSC